MGYRSGCYSRACVRSLLVSWRTHTHTRWRVGIWQGRRYKERPGRRSGVCVRRGTGEPDAPGRQARPPIRTPVCQSTDGSGVDPKQAGRAAALPPDGFPGPPWLWLPERWGGRGGRSACRIPHARRVDCVDCPRLLLLPLSLLLLSMPVGWRRHLSADPLPRMRGQESDRCISMGGRGSPCLY